jgi:hypothetical protein
MTQLSLNAFYSSIIILEGGKTSLVDISQDESLNQVQTGRGLQLFFWMFPDMNSAPILKKCFRKVK